MNTLLRIVGMILLVVIGHLGAQSKPIAISAARIHVGDGTIIEQGMVIVHDGRIVAIGKDLKVPEDAEVLAFPKGSITPGLIDAACALNAPPQAEQSSEVVPHLTMADAIDLSSNEFTTLAREGVTTVFVTGDPASVVGSQATILKTGDKLTGRFLETRGAVKGTLTQEPENRGLNNSTPFGRGPVNLNTRRPTTQMGTVFVFRDAFQKSLSARDSGRPVNDPATATLIEVLDGRKPLRIAATALHEISAAIRLSREFNLKFTLERATEIWRILDEVKAAQVPVVYGPVTTPAAGGDNRFFRRGPEAERKLNTALKLHQAGIPFVLTAHAGRGESGLARQVMAAIRYGLPREEALRAVTSRAAQFCNIQDRVGSLKTGLDADLVIWSGEPFEATSLQEAVYIQGERVKGRVY